MGIYLNPGNDLFRQAVNSKIYVDKTMLSLYSLIPPRTLLPFCAMMSEWLNSITQWDSKWEVMLLIMNVIISTSLPCAMVYMLFASLMLTEMFHLQNLLRNNVVLGDSRT